MAFGEYFNALSALGNAYVDGLNQTEAANLLNQQLDAALAAQGQQAAVAPAGANGLTALGQGPAQPSKALPTFATLGGDLGSYLAQTRARESGGNDTAKNPNSTATGRYQFTTGTWNAVARQHPELGLTPNGRLDPDQQDRAMQAFTRDNAAVLSSKGIPINPATLYGAHFLGAGGAASFIPAAINNPDAPAASLAPKAAAANRTVFYNKDGSPKTAGEVYAWLGGAGGGRSTRTATPTLPAGASGLNPGFLPQRAAAIPQGSGLQAPAPQSPAQAVSMPADQAQAQSQADPDAANKPVAGAVPTGFQIPGQAPQSDFVPGTVASPPVAAPSAPVAPGGGLAPAAAQRLSQAQADNLRAMLRNPLTQPQAAKIIEGLNKPDEFSFQVVGDQLIRTSKSGRAEVVPNITKPATLQNVTGPDGNAYTFNPQTGEYRRAIEGKDKQYTDLITPEDRAAAGIPTDYKGPAQKGPNGELRLPGKANTEINMPAAEKAQDVKIGTAYGDTFNELQSGGRSAAGQINTLRLMEKLIDNPNFYSGTGSSAFLAAKRAAASLGLKGAEEAAAPNELFTKIATQSLLDKAGGSLGAGISNSDVMTLNRTIANPENTPEGNRQIIQFGKALAQRQIEVAKLARQYASAHNGRLDPGFDDVLSAYAEKNPLGLELTPLQRQQAQAPQASAPATAAPQGASQAPPAGIREGATATNPRTGQKVEFRSGRWQPVGTAPSPQPGGIL